MRFRSTACLMMLLFAAGCRARRLAEHAVTTGPMPANTVMLSDVMRTLSAQPGFTQTFLAQVQGGSKNGAALLTPSLVNRLRDQIVGNDWQGLDRFPGWTMREINPTVRVVGHVAGKDEKVEDSATAGGAPKTAGAATAFLDMGPLAADKAGAVSLDTPAAGAGFVSKDYVASLGAGMVRGDNGNPKLTPLHASSVRMAELLNRLSLNGDNGAAKFEVQVSGKTATSPEELIANLAATGHEISIADSRYFANFGHLHFNGEDVMMPFWVNSQILVPGTNRPLLVPVSHAEYEWFIKGPKVTAAVSFYFGVDGKAEWRTMDQLDQAWVENRHAHEYTGDDAIEVTKLTGEMVRTYLHLHAAHPAIPFGGYYAFGVCQDVVAAVELKMTGTTTLFPNTADASFFTDPADAEINELIRRIPKDRDGRPPQVERIFGSLPVGSSDVELAAVSVPGLGQDLVAAHDAWTAGTLQRAQTGWRRWLWAGWILVGLLVLAGWLRRRG